MIPISAANHDATGPFQRSLLGSKPPFFCTPNHGQRRAVKVGSKTAQKHPNHDATLAFQRLSLDRKWAIFCTPHHGLFHGANLGSKTAQKQPLFDQITMPETLSRAPLLDAKPLQTRPLLDTKTPRTMTDQNGRPGGSYPGQFWRLDWIIQPFHSLP